jgi:hypothetical protein
MTAKISPMQMIEALLDGGVNPKDIKLIRELTERELEALETELSEINYSPEPWTEQAIARQTRIVTILDAAGRL